MISGQEAGNANPTYNVYSAARGYPLYVTNLKNATGILVGLAGFDYSSDPTPAYGFPQITTAGVLATVNINIMSHWNQGGIVTVMFGANNPWTGGAGNDINTNGHRITDAITPGTAAYSNWIAQLDAVATALNQLQDAGVVVLWRPLHEMNGHWFWWGSPANPQDYKDFWQHMFNYFTNTKKLNNLIWVYAASSGVSSPQNSVNTYYPGSNFVDIVALDGYKDTIDAAIVAAYNSLLLNGKPFALAEYGPASPPAGNLSTTGEFDYSTLITGIRNNLPKTSYFMAWADCPTCNPKVYWSIASNTNANVLLSDPWVINASDLAIDLQNLPSIAPGAPTAVSATAGNAQATVSFTAPTGDGSSNIISFTVTSIPGTKTGTGTASPIVVTGLMNGTSYTFTVTATNSVGSSASSMPSNAVTPSAATTSDCLFIWAENSFPQFFAPAGPASHTSTPYYFRYYSGTGNYLATNSIDNHLWALGVATGGNLADLGPLTSFVTAAGCSQ